jgi:NADPH:quinone reductase-like Zn-dependent oxidoreductase
MKPVRLLEYGGQLVFNDVPTPTIGRDEILVKIKSTAVNHLDLVEASSRPSSGWDNLKMSQAQFCF